MCELRMSKPLGVPHLPQTLTGHRVFTQLVKGIVFAQCPEATLEVIDDRPRCIRLRPIRPETCPEMNIMVNRRFFAFAVCEI